MDNITDAYNFRPVSEMLTTSGQPTTGQLRAAAAAGYEVIINLALHDDPRYSLPDETGLVQSLDMVYAHLPVQFDQPTKTNLLDFFRVMETHDGKKIHVHCAANMRVTAFLGLYFMLIKRRTDTEAFETMRSVWQPDGVWSLFISNILADYSHFATQVPSSDQPAEPPNLRP